MLSIIIPALNEEKYLPHLLQSIKDQQTKQEIEIIVADAGSEDKTRELAQKFGCKVIKGGFQSEGRNRGAKIAKGNILVFADADTILPPRFLKEALQKLKTKGVDGATFFIYPIERGAFKKIIFTLFYNYPVLFWQKILPAGAMVFVVKKQTHIKAGGFDESIVLLEDLEYLKRLQKTGKYRMLRRPYVYVSARRFQEEGWIGSYLKLFFGSIYTLVFGPIKKDIFHYHFGHHNEDPD